VRFIMQRPWKVLIVTAVAVFMSFLDVTIVNVAFPDIERDFPNASRADLSWILNAYNIVFAALLVPAGRLADLIGRRRMFLI
jgi:MFS family permease